MRKKCICPYGRQPIPWPMYSVDGAALFISFCVLSISAEDKLLRDGFLMSRPLRLRLLHCAVACVRKGPKSRGPVR